MTGRMGNGIRERKRKKALLGSLAISHQPATETHNKKKKKQAKPKRGRERKKDNHKQINHHQQYQQQQNQSIQERTQP